MYGQETRDVNDAYVQHVCWCLPLLTSRLSDGGGDYCLCQPVRERERRRECSRLSTAVLWELSPHTCYLIGPGGRRSERDPDRPTCSRQSRVHPSPPPLAKPCVNNTPLNDFLKLLAKCGEKTTPCYTSKMFQKLLRDIYLLYFIFGQFGVFIILYYYYIIKDCVLLNTHTYRIRENNREKN